MEAFLSSHWTEQGALLTGIIYVILAARESVWCWPWGIVSSSLWAYGTLVLYSLYADFGLQLFYVLMGCIGLYQWRFGSGGGRELAISRMSWRDHLQLVGLGVLLGLFFGYFFANYTQAAATYADAFTTSFSILATFLVIQKKLENWLYWIVTDLAYVALYVERGAKLYAALMILYTLIAIFGYEQWKKHLKRAART
ncbi:MAG: nicotinamide riboside transporter PnuC [Bacteroidota bacterium]